MNFIRNSCELHMEYEIPSYISNTLWAFILFLGKHTNLFEEKWRQSSWWDSNPRSLDLQSNALSITMQKHMSIACEFRELEVECCLFREIRNRAFLTTLTSHYCRSHRVSFVWTQGLKFRLLGEWAENMDHVTKWTEWTQTTTSLSLYFGLN